MKPTTSADNSDFNKISELDKSVLTPEQVKQGVENGYYSILNGITKVGTIALLRQLNIPIPTVWVSGYYTIGDGAFGSKLFEWDDTSTDDDNGGTIIKLTNIAIGRYKLKFSGAVNVKWFGAMGDGVTDDSNSFRNCWIYSTTIFGTLVGRISMGMYLPAGKYLISQNNIFNITGVPNYYTSLNSIIYGSGMGQTKIIFRPTMTDAYLYDQRIIDCDALVFLNMKDMHLVLDNSLIGGANIDCFYLKPENGTATQGFQFENFKFTGIKTSVFLNINGTINGSENKFINCKFTTLKNLIVLNNYEALNHNLINTDIELIYGDMIVAKKGASLTMYGGSVIFAPGANNETSVLSLEGSYSGGIFSFYGLRIEYRHNLARVIRCEISTCAATVVFDNCVAAMAGASTPHAFGKSTIQNNLRLFFKNCTFPEGLSSSKFEFIDNPVPTYKYNIVNGDYSLLSFEGCSTFGDSVLIEPYADFSQLTIPYGQSSHMIEYTNCRGITTGNSNRGTLRNGSSPGLCGKLIPFIGTTFPYSNGTNAIESSTYFRLDFHYGEFIKSITVSRASTTNYSSTDYILEIVDNAEFITPGSGVIYGTMPTQKFNLAINWTIEINKSFKTEIELDRTLWLRQKPSNLTVAVGPLKNDIGVVYATVF